MAILVLDLVLGEDVGSRRDCCCFCRETLLAPGEHFESFQGGEASDGPDGIFVQVETLKVGCAADV